VRCVLGFQDFEGLFIGYDSHDKAKAIIGKCDTISWLRITTEDTAEWASKRSGKVERLEYMESRGKDGTTVGEHLAERDAIMAAEFMSLPTVKKGMVEGFHMVRGMGGVFRDRIQYEFKVLNKARNFTERPKGTSQELAEWNSADATRLGIEVLAATFTSPSPDTRPTAPNTNTATQDIDDIPRVHFH
jgi:type IV secretory pathway TraG/TraD family ATPase VirD4